MPSLLRMLLRYAWSLWLGGLVVLFIFVIALFHRGHDLGVQAAPVLFAAFAYYHLALGAVAIISIFLLRWREQSRRLTIALALVAVALSAAIVQETLIAPKLQRALREQTTASLEFQRLHRLSTPIYETETVCLLILGMLLPARPPVLIDPAAPG